MASFPPLQGLGYPFFQMYLAMQVGVFFPLVNGLHHASPQSACAPIPVFLPNNLDLRGTLQIFPHEMISGGRS